MNLDSSPTSFQYWALKAKNDIDLSASYQPGAQISSWRDMTLDHKGAKTLPKLDMITTYPTGNGWLDKWLWLSYESLTTTT